MSEMRVDLGPSQKHLDRGTYNNFGTQGATF